jgi:hypothetical protein
VSFTLDVIASMDGNGPAGGGPDFFNVNIGSSQVFSHTFANFAGGNTQSYGPGVGAFADSTTTFAPGSGAAGTDTLGWTDICGCGPEFNDSIYDLTVTGDANGAGVLTVVFNDASNESYSNEHYGIDNVIVDGTLAATPLPAALPLFAGGLGALGFFGRRKKRKLLAA